MSRISSNTKEVINNYYNEKINELNKSLQIYREQYRDSKEEEFKNDINVQEVKSLFKIIESKFGNYCRLSCDFVKYLVEYEETSNYKMLNEEIQKIKQERSQLFVVLENLPKNSKEYIKALKKLELIVKGE